MDFFNDIWKSINNMLFSGEEVTATEQTAAPFNIHPIDFDITVKTMEEIPLVQFMSVDQNDAKSNSADLQNILDDLLGSFSEGSRDMAPLKNINQARVTTMDLPGKAFVKVTEDSTGETIEVFQSVTDMPTTVKNVTDGVLDLINGTTTNMVQKHHIREESNNSNIYIIVALVMVIAIVLSILGIVWCKKNRLKAEKRNLYPVMAVVNSEYMNPQALRNNEKLKEIP